MPAAGSTVRRLCHSLRSPPPPPPPPRLVSLMQVNRLHLCGDEQWPPAVPRQERGALPPLHTRPPSRNHGRVPFSSRPCATPPPPIAAAAVLCCLLSAGRPAGPDLRAAGHARRGHLPGHRGAQGVQGERVVVMVVLPVVVLAGQREAMCGSHRGSTASTRAPRLCCSCACRVSFRMPCYASRARALRACLQPATYKRYDRPASLAHLVPGLTAEGVDLLTRMMQYDPAKRITAREAMDVSCLPAPHARARGLPRLLLLLLSWQHTLQMQAQHVLVPSSSSLSLSLTLAAAAPLLLRPRPPRQGGRHHRCPVRQVGHHGSERGWRQGRRVCCSRRRGSCFRWRRSCIARPCRCDDGLGRRDGSGGR